MFNQEKVQAAVSLFLDGIGENPDREGLQETPKRVAGYWSELLEGQNLTNEQIAKMFGKTFVVSSNPLVVKTVKNVFSHCEHHLALMYNMTVTVAYLPVRESLTGGYRVIGLSKIPRIVKMCAKRLQLQEKLAEDISECIQIATGSNDVYVNIIADHACVAARGAANEGKTDVTSIIGRFATDDKLRSEVERKAEH